MDKNTDAVIAVAEEVTKNGIFTPKRLAITAAVLAVATVSVLAYRKIRDDKEEQEIQNIRKVIAPSVQKPAQHKKP